MSGANPAAARTSGVNPKRMVLTTIILSGAVAGLIGLGPLMTDAVQQYGDQFPKTLGFTGLALALLGRNHPVGIAAAALVWATIERATQPLSTIGIPQEIGVILQGSFLLAGGHRLRGRQALEPGRAPRPATPRPRRPTRDGAKHGGARRDHAASPSRRTERADGVAAARRPQPR